MSEFRFASSDAPRLALGGFLLVAAIGLGQLGVGVVGLVADLREDAGETRSVIERAAAIDADSGVIAGVTVYQGGTPEDARARFQTDVQELAQSVGLDIETVTAAEMRVVNGHVRLGLALQGALPEARMGDLMVALSRAEPTLLVDEVELRQARGRTSSGSPRKLPVKLALGAYATQ